MKAELCVCGLSDVKAELFVCRLSDVKVALCVRGSLDIVIHQCLSSLVCISLIRDVNLIIIFECLLIHLFIYLHLFSSSCRRYISVCIRIVLSFIMKLEKQEVELPVQNFDMYIGSGIVKKNKHGDLLPDSIRCIIAGPSSSGKTNVLFNLLFDPNGLRFENIYVFSKSLYEPKYKFLKKVMPKEVGYFAYDDNNLVVHPNDAKPNSIMIFDDISCEKHDNIRSFFAMGRHKHIDTFYLGQTYSRIPKQLVRDNCNFLILFKQDDMNLRHVYSDHVTTDMSFEKFKDMCAQAWRDNHGFLVIDKTLDPYKGRYRVGMDSFVTEL